MVSKLRRLIADHAALHEELPPNYLFPPEDASDDMTQLTTLLAGPQGTPYSQGLWRLHLKMPEDYPKSPPKATFKTRIWHPNVEESTGAVCVDTLKRDWKPTLTLTDVLVTISCLLIYPNPDSALNSSSGALLQEDYDAFARQAKLMTSIHAPVPADMRDAVTEAKMRGEDAGTAIPEQEELSRNLRSRKGTRIQSVTMKKRQPARKDAPSTPDPESQQLSDDENENLSCASKENDPSLSPTPVKLATIPSLSLSPRKNAHGKRPLADLTTTMDVDPFVSDAEDVTDNTDGMTASERNIAANTTPRTMTPTRETRERVRSRDPSPQRKSPKLSILNRGPNSTTITRVRDDIVDMKIYEDTPDDTKENHSSASSSFRDLNTSGISRSASHPLAVLSLSTAPSNTSSSSSSSRLLKPASASSLRKVSGPGSGMKKAKPRIGIRRL
ncbi:ubiquitin-conjugating enzyme/RWD-like protein [Aspergillus pseudoustus]|uniref:Ubiquitin-conjugating enzyme/RWD-like protein n=1 Tax=Aspergillus pseudoustus TaxID=1810923 RepID=A0ABR4JSW5_9EURO